MLTTAALDDVVRDAAPAAAKSAKPAFTAKRGTYCCGRLEYGWEPWHLGPYHPDVYRANKMQLFNETVAGITVAFAQVSTGRWREIGNVTALQRPATTGSSTPRF